MIRQRGPAIAALLAVVCGLVAVLVPLVPVRIVAGLPLALFLPGYAATAATFGPDRPDRGREILLAFGASLALLALGGLLLSAVGIYPGTWALLLVALTVGGCVVAAIRRRRAPSDAVPPRRPRRRLRLRDAVLLGAALAIAAGATVMSQVPFDAGKADGYTALWMLPGRGGKSVEVGVASAQHTPWPYRLVVNMAGGSPIHRPFTLEPGEEKIYRLRLPAGSAQGPVKVIASLYRAGPEGRPYRQVVNWVTPEGSS